MTIQERINNLRVEQSILRERHDAMIAENSRANQQFQAAVQQSQNRFQQIAGAIAELEQMQAEAQETDGKEPALANRLNK
jgi:hypothetical protein